jgi:hypothetical protein
MPDPLDCLEAVLACLKQMEATLLGLKHLRAYIAEAAGKEKLDALIVEAESHLAELKSKLIQ